MTAFNEGMYRAVVYLSCRHVTFWLPLEPTPSHTDLLPVSEKRNGGTPGPRAPQPITDTNGCTITPTALFGKIHSKKIPTQSLRIARPLPGSSVLGPNPKQKRERKRRSVLWSPPGLPQSCGKAAGLLALAGPRRLCERARFLA